MKNPGNLDINRLFDLVPDPGFVTATVTQFRETREDKRKRKIKNILKNPLKWVGFLYE